MDAAGHTVLTYAVRGGRAGALLVALGAASVVAGAWGINWMLSGGGVTPAGLVFVVLVPGGLMAFGAHCLDTALWARREYVLSSLGLVAKRHSLRGSKLTMEIGRAAVTGVAQRYTPPGPSSPSGSPGTWTTFVVWQGGNGRMEEFALDGLGSPDEARWLGPLLAKWAGKPLTRGHGAAFDEADPAELPTLDA